MRNRKYGVGVGSRRETFGKRVASACAAGSALVMLLTCESPAAPLACGTIPQQMLYVGESATVAACFNDPDGDALRYSVSSSDPGVATATSAGGKITIVAVSPGEARVSVVAADGTGRSAQQSFDVLVPNRPPVVVRGISGFVGSVGPGAIVVDLSRHFSDPDGEVLDYTAEFDPAIVQISIDAEWMAIVNIAKGTVTVVVTATDPGGLKATESFPVTAPNRPPLSAATVPGQTIEVGDTSRVVVAPHFTDPDGDALTYSVVITDTLVATTAVRDSVVAVTGVAKGSATVTVTATDTEGLKASLSFAVTVPNRGPVVVDAIPALTMGVGREAAMELGSYFGDPDGDGLAFAAVAADSTVVAISLDRGSVTVTAISKGESMVTVTATDTEGLTAAQVFEVTVPNSAPALVHEIPTLTMVVGAKSTMDLAEHFADPDGDGLAYTVTTADEAVAVVSADGDAVTVAAVAKGNTTITVIATDSEGLAVTHGFVVIVPNRAPVGTGTLRGRVMPIGVVTRVDASSFFMDPDGDELTYGAVVADSLVVRATADARYITLTGSAKGSSLVTVTATDTDGASLARDFLATVPNRAPVPIEAIPEQKLKVGSETTMDLAPHFGDPDGDTLVYTARSYDAGVAGVVVVGDSLTVLAKSGGKALVLAAAIDTEEVVAIQHFTVKVAEKRNNPPRIEKPIPTQVIESNGTKSLDITLHFDDLDDDTLSYETTSSAPHIATATVDYGMLEVEGHEPGEATITVTATDPDGASAAEEFGVTVSRQLPVNQAPEVTSVLDPRTVVEDALFSIDLTDYFNDPEGDSLSFEAATSDSEVVSVNVAGNDLAVRAVGFGTATVTVTARDSEGRSATTRFVVSVIRTGGTNQPPLATVRISDRTLAPGDTLSSDLDDHFTDPESQTMTFVAVSADASVATATVSGDTLTVVAVGGGNTTVTVTATDPGQRSATQRFVVTVTASPPANRAPTVKTTPPDRTFVRNKGYPFQPWNYFSDPDGDGLTWTATTSDAGVATLYQQHPQSAINVMAVSEGTSTITTTVTDPGGLTAEASFVFTVGNTAPLVRNQAPALTSSPGQVDTVTMNSAFEDNDGGDELRYAGSSSDTAKVAVSIQLSGLSGYYARIVGKGIGDATVTLTARDLGGLRVSQSFVVSVDSNRPPRLKKAFPLTLLTVGDTASFVMSDYFDDPDGDDLTYTARVGFAGSAHVSGDTVYIIAENVAVSTAQVTAHDTGGKSTDSDHFYVLVGPASTYSLAAPSRFQLTTTTEPVRPPWVLATRESRRRPRNRRGWLS
ncbi:MAG: hypothetical protein F4Z31_17760 [Gemmatimonadetes bacterium]|nr:hypothetical protein [Gemmatimonadota bacterium]MYE95509.1 hypothetical protein [Gemmatimonadota bacterium]MYJ09604.1 hypothetical protein [Gemmatimonadota bacterium]